MSLANFTLFSKTTLSKIINSRLAHYNYEFKSKRNVFVQVIKRKKEGEYMIESLCDPKKLKIYSICSFGEKVYQPLE